MSKHTRNRAAKRQAQEKQKREQRHEAEQQRRLGNFRPASVGEMVDAVRHRSKPKDIMVAPKAGR